ncbi:MAG: FAD-dependent thymidylate synthase, partial [Actinobacteria bacterium]|nr:FAD-dependent thymidylate synthase [Actinomycetota bacterium]
MPNTPIPSTYSPDDFKFDFGSLGSVTLINSMGDDFHVLNAARVSHDAYDSENRTEADNRRLLRYLLKNKHTSPFEHVKFTFLVDCPIFVARQWHRHRTWCLAGDTMLDFSLPSNSHPYRMTIKDAHEKFQPNPPPKRRGRKQGNPFYKRDRVMGMKLRSVDEATGELIHTSITDVWESGVKDVYKVQTLDGKSIKMTLDHLCYTDLGWMSLGEASGVTVLPDGEVSSFSPKAKLGGLSYVPGETPEHPLPELDEDSEEWRSVPKFEGRYEVSSEGRVRSLINTRNKVRPEPYLKVQSVANNGYPSVSLSGDQKSTLRTVHSLVAEAFIGPRGDGIQVRHLNGNPLDSRLSNLCYGTQKDNSEDAIEHGRLCAVRVFWSEIESLVYVGKEMTYDLSVEGPYHNFSANGLIVHNCYNEVSAR